MGRNPGATASDHRESAVRASRRIAREVDLRSSTTLNLYIDALPKGEPVNSAKESYPKSGLVRDMLAVPGLIRSFDAQRMRSTSEKIAQVGRLLMPGEGSSRLFPAKSTIA